MRRPVWWQDRGPFAWMLLPIAIVYSFLDLLNRCFTRGQVAPLPVICVGNLTAGGTGKTPVTQALAQLFLQHDIKPAILSRGYGRKSLEPLRVEPGVHTWEQVGDEPLLHAQICPTYVATNRLDAAYMAQADGAQVLLLDDGLQHYRLIKDIVVEVRNSVDGIGNGFPLPAGPLRQWFGLGTGSTDVQIIVGKDALVEASLPKNLNVSGPVGAFCCIADPAKFESTLGDLGIIPDWFAGYPDHHAFTSNELDMLQSKAKDMTLLTTQKDWVRLSHDLQRSTHAIDYRVCLADPHGIWDVFRSLSQGVNTEFSTILN